MVDFEIQRCTRHCASTGREFEPGERFYSALVAEGANVVRLDYTEEAWQQPPENAIGWWKSQMPAPNAKRINWAPNDVMLQYFEQLEGETAKLDVRYVLALLMIRRRIFRLEEAQVDDSGQQALVLYCPKNETEYLTPVVEPEGERVKQIQDELARLLFGEAT